MHSTKSIPIGDRRAISVGARIRLSDNWQRWLIAIAGASLAFLFGYWFASLHPMDDSWHQSFLLPALNFACTGHFGPIRLPQDAPAGDVAALQGVYDFLQVHAMQFSCSAFPAHTLPTSVFDGLDSTNVDQPMYLIGLYGVLWRWLGPHWTLTHYVIATIVAASFLVTYLCACRFMPPLLAAGVVLFFIASPFFIKNAYWSPRDALKYPWAVGIAALLIARATVPRRPLRFVGFAAGLGLLIGIGYGFRSDLLLFALPAVFIIAFLGQVELVGAPLSRARRAASNVAVRALAVGALSSTFVAGGWLPLLNDYYLHEHNRNAPYHSLAAGLLGITDVDLFQSQRDGVMYMFRNDYENDLCIGVRVLEYGSRRYGHDAPFAQGLYWTDAKQYYFDVVSRTPADVISRALGAFVNLMTLPGSSQSLANFDQTFPWTDTYSFARDTIGFKLLAAPVERIYQSVRHRQVEAIFLVNFTIAFSFLCLIARTFGFRSLLAAVILLGTVIFVVSLRFEMRHMFYLYAFPLIAWASAIHLAFRFGPPAARRLVHRFRGKPAEKGDLAAAPKRLAPTVAAVAVLTLGIAAGAYVVLSVARAYQAKEMRALVSDWLKRERAPMQFDTVTQTDGTSLVRVRSPMPISTGGLRGVDDPVTERVQMGVIAIELDGTSCADRIASIIGMGISEPDVDTSFRIKEIFKVKLEHGTNYIAFLPAFFYRLGGVVMRFSGVQTPSENLSCIRSVSALNEFKKDDALFDFFVPEDLGRLRDKDLYQHLKIGKRIDF